MSVGEIGIEKLRSGSFQPFKPTLPMTVTLRMVDPKKAEKADKADKSKVVLLDVEGATIKWDMNVQWRKRAKIAVDKYASEALILEAIKAVETPGVVKLIDKKLQ